MSIMSVVVLVYALGSWVLAGVYALLYREERNDLLRKLMLSWFVHGLSLLFYLLSIHLDYKDLWVYLSHICVLAAASLLFCGMAALLEHKVPCKCKIVVPLLLLWISILSFWGKPIWLVSLPLYLMVSFVYCWSGIMLLVSKSIAKLGKFFLGVVMLVWGVHKLNYPLVHYLPEFKVYGFMIAMALLFLTAIGTLIVYFVKSRREYMSSQKQWDQDVKYCHSYFEYSPLAIVVVNFLGEVIDINPASVELIGYERDEIIGKNCMSFVSSQDKNVIYKEWLSLIKKGKAYAEGWIVMKNRQQKFVAMSSTRINNQRLAIFITDMTDNKNSALQLADALEKAQETEKMKSSFLAMMSHEIRTPLNAVVGFTDLVLEDGVGDEQKAYLNNVKNSANFLIKTIEDILELSKLESGSVKVKEELVFLRKLVDDVCARAQITLKNSEKKVALLQTIDREVEELIYCDRTKLEQILNNLVHNAVKFTEEGSIEIIVSLKGPDKLQFLVRDTGLGIDKKDCDSIFEEFKQVDMSDTRSHGGLGLGLSLCKRLAKLLNAELTLESNKGINHGTSFSLVLDYKAELENANGQLDVNETVKSVLVVEDDPVSQKLMVTFLSQYDCEVLTANNGQEAWNMFMRKPEIKLVIMDMQMPIMDGFATMSKIRRYEAEKKLIRVPIIALTALTMPDDRKRCEDAGCDKYMLKPIQLDLFSDFVKELAPDIKSKNK